MGLSDYFTFSVDVAFDAGPFSASPTWTEVTDDVLASEGVTFSRGTRSVGSRVGPGLADLTMRNWAEVGKVAGRWTPGVAASPWHPLKLKRRLRIEVEHASVAHPLWSGHITDHTPGWVGAGKATCGLSCSDVLAALARVDALPDLMVGEQLTESPSYLWPLDDSEDSTTAGNRTGAAAAILTRTAVGSPTNAALDFGGASTPTGQPSATFTPDSLTAGYSLNGDVAGLGATNGLVIECAVKPEGSTAGVQPLILLLDDGTGAWLAVCREVGYGISIRQGTRLAGWTGTPTAYMDATLGLWATVGVRLYSGGGTIEITGGGPGAGSIFGGGTIGGPGSGFSPTVVYVGGVAGNIVATNGATFEGSLANVALYASDWANATPTRLTTHLGSFSPALADVRFEGLCRSTGLPTALYSADASTQQVLPAPTAGRQLTAALNEVADSDRGSINVDAEGALRFSGRDTRHGVATSVTLDARTDILNSLDGLAYNDEDLVNDATVTRDGGATVRHVNQASVDEYGSLTATADVILNSDDDAQALAEWLANAHSQPAIKAPTLRVSMLNIASRSSSKAAALCALDLGQRITVTNLPAGLPATTLELFVEGINDEVTANDWIRTITTSNITRGGAVWVLGDATYSVLGSTTILA